MRNEKPQILAQITSFRDARPRHFWLTAGAATASFSAVVTAFAIAPHTDRVTVERHLIVEQISLPATDPVDIDTPFVRQTQIRRGDTAATLFGRLGIDDDELIAQLRSDPKSNTLFRQLRPGRIVTARTNAEGELLSLYFPLNGSEQALYVQREDGRMEAKQKNLALETEIISGSGEIHSSLFAATDAANIPDAVAVQMAEIFGGSIDFHRDLRKGDRFTVVYEMQRAEGQVERTGRVLAAEFVNDGKVLRAFLFDLPGGSSAYYDDKGKSLKKAFLRSPLEFSRITSGFAMRMHPILGTMRAHKGVDYAAPVGTRVRAAGDGVVDSIGVSNGYGNMLVLRHRGEVSTVYAHLSGFAAGLHKGTRVSQGDTIAFVGQTGLATGPHLHYEFRVEGVHKDPLKVAMPETPPITGATLDTYLAAIQPASLRLSLIGAGPLSALE